MAGASKKTGDTYEVPIDEFDLYDIDTVHDYLRVTLGFPDHYGKNLDALYDCLGDIDTPTRLFVLRDATASNSSTYACQMDELCTVLFRAARQNPLLTVSIGTFRWHRED